MRIVRLEKFFGHQPVFVNAERVAFVLPGPHRGIDGEHSTTLLYFGGANDDYLEVSGGVLEVMEKLYDEWRTQPVEGA